MYRVGFRSANPFKVSLVTLAAMLAICLLALVETTNTAGADDSLPENGKIAFSTFPMNGTQSVYLINSDGSNLTRLTAPLRTIAGYEVEGVEAGMPAISPDGTEIAFSGYEVVLGEPSTYGIYVMDAKDRDGDGNGDNIKRLSEGNWLNVYSPTWSPDGKKIAFTSDRDDGDDHQETDIYVMNADGSNPTNLTNRPGEGPDSASEDYPAFSPDGKKIAFATSRDLREDVLWRADWEIYVMSADGSNETRLTENGGYAPTFSPNGKKIAFANHTYLFNQNDIRYDENDKPDENGKRFPYARVADIYVLNADGSDETRLTNNSFAIDPPGYVPNGNRPKSYFEMHAYPAYSPDGSRIAFSRGIRRYYENGNKESYRRQLYSMKADGTDLVLLANDLGLDEPPRVDWGPKPGTLVKGMASAKDEPSDAPKSQSSERSVIVKPGDSLWSISEQRLGPEASPQRVYDHTYQMYALNRKIIGADPDLIFVGQRLSLPPPRYVTH